jgi:hypothetical protein
MSEAVEAVALSVKQITTQGWQLQDVAIGLSHLEKTPQLQLSIQKLLFPKPFNDLKLLNVQCQQFYWGNNEIHCQQGKAQLQSKTFNSPRFNFTFHITQKQSQFQIQQLKLFEGLFDLQGSEQANQWQLSLNGKQIGLKVLHDLLFPKLKLSSGKLTLTAKAQGNQQGLSKFNLQTQTDNLSIQTADGTKASEKLQLNLRLNANKTKSKLWMWETENAFQQGSLYIEPLYLENKGQPISLEGYGYWDEARQQLEINSAKFNHPEIGFIRAYGVVNRRPKVSIAKADVHLNIPLLENATPIYLEPFTSATALEGLSLAGKLESRIKLNNQTITDAYLISNKLAITDKKQRIEVVDGLISLYWANRPDFNKSSLLSWQKLKLFGIPLESSYFPLLLKQQQISLLHEINIPLLQGQLKIKQFDWQKVADKPPYVHFSGQIQQVSLEQLSHSLNWQRPLSGNISGEIPSVNFTDGKLTLDGGLKINVFDGEINIRKLALSGFLTDFSQFYSDIEINNLDLEQITQKFSFGGMQGRISGFVKDLYLENWQPVTFYAWLGTPEGDDSTHQISQKAVKNIASIGGGGVIDLLSRTVLSLFDNFGYDELGLGCYLHNGVCQLMGVAPAEQGYYIVKGGGLPRIDVMGYNPRIDWAVLQERLERIAKSSTDAVIE